MSQAFGDSYTYVQGTHGHVNSSFVSLYLDSTQVEQRI